MPHIHSDNTFKMISYTITLLLFALTQVYTLKLGEYEKGCESNPADIVFVLDESGSIWGPDFDRQIEFVISVIQDIPVGKDKSHFGVMTFSDDTREHMLLGQYNTDAEMVDVLNSIPQRRGGTKTFIALERMRTFMFSPRYIRPQVAHIAIVITDGESEDMSRTAQQAALAKAQGITVFAIGVGRSVNIQELKNIASEPASEYMYEVPHYSALEKLRKDLAWKACNVVTTPEPTTTTAMPTTTLPQMIESCSGRTPVDVIFSLSDQAGIKETNLAYDLIKAVISETKISPVQVQVGLAPRNCFSTEAIKLSDHDSNVGFLRDLDKRRLTATGAWTDLQISYLNKDAFSAGNGARPKAIKYAIVIIDNTADDMARVMEEVEIAARKGIKLVLVGVGPYIDPDQLKEIAGDNVIIIASYEKLLEAKDPLLDRICKSILLNSEPGIELLPDHYIV